jgi:hypothetical protein
VTGAGGRIAFPVGSVNARKQLRLLAGEGVKTRGNRALVVRMPGARKSLDALLWKI